jgi:Protein of unknown function (DUF3710)
MSGPAAADPEGAARLEEAFRLAVVVRGNEPMPVREQLPLTLPAQAMEEIARQQAEAQAAQAAQAAQGDAGQGSAG